MVPFGRDPGNIMLRLVMRGRGRVLASQLPVPTGNDEPCELVITTALQIINKRIKARLQALLTLPIANLITDNNLPLQLSSDPSDLKIQT
ncbi:hypothetical protein Glove_189g25 [Diversispora epigaea]|uniref:Uncharacterized protein n=1 Tax=Diversispora epigaea TaxID=1348612 RepID=A0A397ILR0_9GLOM|nr:hypothetical protein Glove_189g25 [Diversispora epigaea]